MKKFPVVLDIETKHTFREYKEHTKLGVSIAVIYDYKDNQVKAFFEKDLSKLFSILESCSYVIGYNVKSFDLPVLQGYYPGKIENFGVFDILDDIREKLGRRIGLNDVASATINAKKSGHGLMAIDYYKEGKWDELKKYCTDDVLVTKDIFEYGMAHGEIFYMNETGKVPIKVSWKRYLEDNGNDGDMPLTLPF